MSFHFVMVKIPTQWNGKILLNLCALNNSFKIHKAKVYRIRKR